MSYKNSKEVAKTIVIFGGSGFIGGYVVNELLKRHYRVIVVDLNPPKYFPDVEFIACNILDPQNVLDAIYANTHAVYNFAGFASLDAAVDNPYDTFNLNVMGNLNIMEAVKKKNINRYIFASSAYAMSNKGSFYGISKLTSEKIIEEYQKKYNCRYTIIRYGSVYSEQNHYNNYIYNLIRKALRDHRIIHHGDGEELREYIHAADAAKLSVDVLEQSNYENQHLILTGHEKMKRIELFNMIKEIANRDIEIELYETNNSHHYQFTPYAYEPTSSKKLTCNPYIDMGQGLLECIKQVCKDHSDSNQD